MAAARKHDRRPELGNHCRLHGNKLGIDGGDKIPVARDLERGNGHRRSGKGSQQLPAAIDVAVPAEGTAEPAPQKPLSQLVDAEMANADDRVSRSRTAMARMASTLSVTASGAKNPGMKV